jgi:hypothetical protein
VTVSFFFFPLKTKDDETPLDIARRRGHKEIVELITNVLEKRGNRRRPIILSFFSSIHFCFFLSFFSPRFNGSRFGAVKSIRNITTLSFCFATISNAC